MTIFNRKKKFSNEFEAPSTIVLNEQKEYFKVNECQSLEDFRDSIIRSVFGRISLDIVNKIKINNDKYHLQSNSFRQKHDEQANILSKALNLYEISLRRLFRDLTLIKLETNLPTIYYFDKKYVPLDQLSSLGKVTEDDLVLKAVYNLNDIDDAVVSMYNSYLTIVRSTKWNNKSIFRLNGWRATLAAMADNLSLIHI